MHADGSREERATDLVHTVLFRQLRRTLPATNLAVRQVVDMLFSSLSHVNTLLRICNCNRNGGTRRLGSCCNDADSLAGLPRRADCVSDVS